MAEQYPAIADRNASAAARCVSDYERPILRQRILAKNSSQHYETLLSDEVEGGLDPKGYVHGNEMRCSTSWWLSAGGYRVVDATPAVMADKTINFGQWNRNGQMLKVQITGSLD